MHPIEGATYSWIKADYRCNQLQQRTALAFAPGLPLLELVTSAKFKLTNYPKCLKSTFIDLATQPMSNRRFW